MIFRCRPATITLAADGDITSVVHDADPGVGYLVAGGRVDIRCAGRSVEWQAPVVNADQDEVELTREAAGLRVVVRHTFAAGWGVRVALTNLGPEPSALDEVTLGWRPAPDLPAWALAAGATGSYAVQPPTGRGPVLGGLLTQGSFDRVTADGLVCGPLELAPGGRYVLQWRWDWYPEPRAFDRGRHPGVPRWFSYRVGETAQFVHDEDQALLDLSGVEVDTADGVTELTAPSPGSHPVELRGARGVTRYDVTWVDPLDQVVADVVTDALDGPLTPAGVVRLADVHTALAGQYALGRNDVDDRDALEDALGLFAARTEDDLADPYLLTFWVGESERTGETELLDRAAAAFVETALAPGLGLAATRLALALVLRGRPVDALVDRLRTLTADGPTASDTATDLTRRAARLEVELVSRSRLATGPDAREDPGVVAQVLRLGGWLGAGLTGHAVPLLPVAVQAQLAATLSLTDPALSTTLRGRWGGNAHELGRRAGVDVLARLGARAGGPALSLLTMAEQLA